MNRLLRTGLCVLTAGMMTFSTAFAKVAVDESQIAEEAKSYAYWNTELTNEERAADLISHMTLEEKISQMGSHPAAAIPRLGVAEYWYPGENLNGIAAIGVGIGLMTIFNIIILYPQGEKALRELKKYEEAKKTK